MGWWRLFLAWLVIAGHTSGYERLFSIDAGTIAVAAFFFISGFLMPLAYNAGYADGDWREGVRRFYLNRFLRIYPVYWLALVIFLVLAVATQVRHGQVDAELLRPSTYLQNFLLLGLNQTKLWDGYYRFDNPAWTLDVELQYYLMVPLLLLTLRSWRGLTIGALVLASLASLYLYLRPTGVVDVDRSLVSWSGLFFVGFGFYQSPRFQQWMGNFRVTAAVAGACFMVAALLNDHTAVSLAIVAGCIAISAHLLVLQKNRAFGSVDRLAGELSYPTYILHVLFLGFTAKLLSGSGIDRLPDATRYAALLTANTIVSVAIAYATYRAVSEPIDRLRSRFRHA
jgi:peptidoglycan/LPS O-acetylase OafA/YrhL